ncbi:MAG: isoprenylcysteine carboxylmethyltransferase family protein [Candidatus Magnetomorum sp.]|nr:isoprenylcysteine carboxylmethyltransferase family protein [Candidatus Magnetomorum sp.]
MNFFVKNRILCTRLIAAVILLLVLFSSHSWVENSLWDMLVQWTGFSLIFTATLGRIWCFVYISGYKDDELIMYGPYSLLRNPLYFFSFIGTLGIGLATENLLAFVLMIVLFCILYPAVVDEEESKLKDRFGSRFEEYQKKTPRWFPRIKYYYESEEYLVKPRIFFKAMMESMWFMWFYMILQIIESLHHLGILPVMFLIP